jgi:hypothetical protein
MRKLVLLLGVAALVIGGCRLDASVSIDIAEDGSGSYSIEAGLDQELRDLLGQFGVSAEDLVQTLQSGLPEGSSTTREEGDLTYFVNSVSFSDPQEVEDTIAGASEATGGDSLFDRFVLEVNEDGARIEAKLDVNLADVPLDTTQLQADALQANFYARLPGTVTSHNADEELADGRLRWALPITGGTLDIQAESSFGGGGVSTPLLIGIAALVVLGGGALLLARVGRKDSVAAVAAAPPPPPPMDFTPPGSEPGDGRSDG